MFISVDENKIVTAISDHQILIKNQECVRVNRKYNIGDYFGVTILKKETKNIRVAFICNWNDHCGISTYSKFLVNELKKQVSEIKIFSEITKEPDENVLRCWKRGESMVQAINQVLAWNPTFIIVQHEYGIFPNACHFLKMLEMISKVPYVVCMHSVYEHLDKTICSSAVKNIIVHSEAGKQVMLSRGHKNQVYVVPHGCIQLPETKELWNIFQTPYAIVQFGFGFFYKGVDRAIEAVNHLKLLDKKFENIFYVYLAAENPHNSRVHDTYHLHLTKKIKDLKLEDNVTIIRGFQSEETINNYLHTAKLAIFPYVNNPNNKVYGASGAIRVAMANKIPIVASESNLFDDLVGVVPRPSSASALANEIDEVFSNKIYRDSILTKISKFIEDNTWEKSAKKYLEVYNKIVGA
jgi:glycosyltransferase involved in cell wall biosynthesis